MTAAEAVAHVRAEFERQNAGQFRDLSVVYHATAFGVHQVDVTYIDQHGTWQSYRVFKSIRGYASSISGLTGHSLGDPGTRR